MEVARKVRRRLVPHNVGLRIAVQQQQRRPATAMAHAEPARSNVDGLEFEIIEKRLATHHRLSLPPDTLPEPPV
jgi:hypothetical protein